jgi:formate dehydrogenase
VLPATTPLERFDLPFAFPLLMGMQSRPYLQATRPVVRPDGEQRDEATIYLDLARASGAPLFGSKLLQGILELSRSLHSRRKRDAQPSLPQERLLSLLLRLTGNGSFAKLDRERHGRPRPPHAAGSFLDEKVAGGAAQLDLAPLRLLEQAEKLEADYATEVASRDRLKLITRRHVKTHNTWTHNHPGFVSPTETWPTCRPPRRRFACRCVCSPISSPGPAPFPTAGATRTPRVCPSRARRAV